MDELWADESEFRVDTCKLVKTYTNPMLEEVLILCFLSVGNGF